MLKWAGIAIGSLVALAVAAALFLPAVVNLERYRNLLASRASRLLGREVTLGALRVSLWGGLGAEAQGIRIAPAPGFGPDPFLTADDLRVRLQFLPLLRGQFKVTSVVLDRPRIRLMKAADGHWNIEDLLKTPAPAAPPRPTPEGPRPARPPLLGGLLLSEVAVKGGEILLVEHRAQTGQPLSVTLSKLNLSLQQKAVNDPILVKAQAELGEAGGRLEASGKVVPESEGVAVDVTVTVRDVEVTPWQALLLASDSAVRLSERLSGELKVNGPLARATFDGTLDLTPLGFRVGSAVQKPAGQAGRLTFRGQRQEPGLQLTALALSLKDVLELEGKVSIPDLRSPQITFVASSPLVDLDRLLARPPAKKAQGASGVAWAAPAAPRQRSDAAAAGSTTAVPMTAQGHLRIAELRYAGLQVKGLEGDLRYRDGVLDLPAVQASFVQGRIDLTGQLDFRAKLPQVRLTSRLAGVQTEPLVKALGQGPWTLQSVLSQDSSLAFAGLSGSDVLGSANGKGSIKLGEGRVLDYKPLDRLAEIIKPILAAQGVQVRLNEFQQVTGTFTLDKGVLRTPDLTLTKTEGTVAAVGSLSLLDSALDFDVNVKLGRTTIEAKVIGTTSKPVVIPKLGRLQQRLENELNKALPGQQGKGLQDLLKGLFGR